MHVIVLLMLEMLEQGRRISVAALYIGYVGFLVPILYLQEKVLFGIYFQNHIVDTVKSYSSPTVFSLEKNSFLISSK